MNGTDSSRDVRRAEEIRVSVVLPVFNEAGVLEELHGRIVDVLRGECCRYEIVFIDDGSTDATPKILRQLAARDAQVRVLHLSRNFGHQAAVQAGLDHATGDVVVLMDSDLQDDPQAISEFLRNWEQGYDVVYAIRHGRKENMFKRCLFHAFYRVLNGVSKIPIPRDAGNFGLLDRKVLTELHKLRECDRYLPGLRSWLGYRQIGVPVERGRRYDDRARVSLGGLFRLAKTAIFSFSTVPLTVFYAIAALSLMTCLGVTGFTLYHKLYSGLAVPGWASMTIVASFFGALNSLGIAILGEYAIRIYDQVRARPTYLLDFPDPTGPQAKLLETAADDWLSRFEDRQSPSSEEEFRQLLEQFR